MKKELSKEVYKPNEHITYSKEITSTSNESNLCLCIKHKL